MDSVAIPAFFIMGFIQNTKLYIYSLPAPKMVVSMFEIFVQGNGKFQTNFTSGFYLFFDFGLFIQISKFILS
jgi:hypothetical protein